MPEQLFGQQPVRTMHDRTPGDMEAELRADASAVENHWAPVAEIGQEPAMRELVSNTLATHEDVGDSSAGVAAGLRADAVRVEAGQGSRYEQNFQHDTGAMAVEATVDTDSEILHDVTLLTLGSMALKPVIETSEGNGFTVKEKRTVTPQIIEAADAADAAARETADKNRLEALRAPLTNEETSGVLNVLITDLSRQIETAKSDKSVDYQQEQDLVGDRLALSRMQNMVDGKYLSGSMAPDDRANMDSGMSVADRLHSVAQRHESSMSVDLATGQVHYAGYGGSVYYQFERAGQFAEQIQGMKPQVLRETILAAEQPTFPDAMRQPLMQPALAGQMHDRAFV